MPLAHPHPIFGYAYGRKHNPPVISGSWVYIKDLDTSAITSGTTDVSGAYVINVQNIASGNSELLHIYIPNNTYQLKRLDITGPAQQQDLYYNASSNLILLDTYECVGNNVYLDTDKKTTDLYIRTLNYD